MKDEIDYVGWFFGQMVPCLLIAWYIRYLATGKKWL